MTNDSFDALVLSRNYKAPIQNLATISSGDPILSDLATSYNRRHLPQSVIFDEPEKDLDVLHDIITSYGFDALETFMIDEWSVGEITVKPIDRVPDDVSFVL